MQSDVVKIGLFGAIQIILASTIWYFMVPNYEWHIVQQFYGHIGPAIFLVALGAAALFMRDNLYALNMREAQLAVIAGAAYVLADTFIMHPPFGVFDGAGNAEQEHVSIMGLVFVLGVSGIVLLKRNGRALPTSAHFVIGIAFASMVFLNHHQHTVAGTIGHQATIMALGAAALFRVLDKMTEYAITIIVAGFIFFASQMGFAMAIDMGGHSAGAWFALWASLGMASATGFVAMAPPIRESGR